MIHACIYDLHSKVTNAKCNVTKWHGKHSDWNNFCSKRFLHSCKDTEMYYICMHRVLDNQNSKHCIVQSSLNCFCTFDNSVHVSPLYDQTLRFMITRLAMYQMPTSYSNKCVIFYEPWVTSKWITLQMRPKTLDYPILIHPTFNPSRIEKAWLYYV